MELMRGIVFGSVVLMATLVPCLPWAQEVHPEDPVEGPSEPEPIDDFDDDEDKDEAEDHHRGFFFRFALGLGWGWIGGSGTLAPAKGLQAIEDPEHNSPAFNLAMSLGGGAYDIALHAGAVYERMILRDDSPTEIGFSLMGIGGGLTYYFTDYDFFATAQIRLMGLLMYMKDVVCDSYFADKYEWYRGPGIALTLGKEWFKEGKNRGLGLGLQFNFARLFNEGSTSLDYMSLVLVLTVSKF